MNIFKASVLAAGLAAVSCLAPRIAVARAAPDYGGGDVCHPAAGAAAAGVHTVVCLGYPSRVADHQPNCHWVREVQDGKPQDFELCRDRDGVWRPSGRA